MIPSKIDGSDDRQQANDVLTWLFSIIAPRNKYKEHQNMNTQHLVGSRMQVKQ